jgi:hypothetical protein
MMRRRLYVYMSGDAESDLAVREFMKSVFANDDWEIVMGDRRALLAGAVRSPEVDAVDESLPENAWHSINGIGQRTRTP